MGIDDQRRAELPEHALAADDDPRPRRRRRRARAVPDRRWPRRPAAAGPVMTGSLLDVRDLHVRIAAGGGTVRAADGVSFEVPRAEAMGLVGESGSGKSMTLRAI